MRMIHASGEGHYGGSLSMIDILSVMVSFLLVYSTNVETIQNTKAIQIPQSVAEQQPRESVVVMITKDQLLVQGEPIASVADIAASQDAVIAPLQAALQRPLLVGSNDNEAGLFEVMQAAAAPKPNTTVAPPAATAKGGKGFGFGVPPPLSTTCLPSASRTEIRPSRRSVNHGWRTSLSSTPMARLLPSRRVRAAALGR